MADALLTENRVVTPFGLSRSTSKYGSSRVAAGTSSMVQITAMRLAAQGHQAQQSEAQYGSLHDRQSPRLFVDPRDK